MSRIGKMPVMIPQGVEASIAGHLLTIKGPKGESSRNVRPEIDVQVEKGKITFKPKRNDKASRAYHGLERALANNMVQGVTSGFSKELELIGVGYRADLKGSVLNMDLGYSHPIDFTLPEGIQAKVIKEGRQIFVRLEGIDKHKVGQVAAEIRDLRPPEPYKGKGVRYKNERVRRKAGKSGK